MFHRPVRAAISLLLITSLLGWTSLSSVCRHSHEGGYDVHHDHDASRGAHAKHEGHHHGHDHAHPHEGSGELVAVLADVDHWHFQWFGLRLMLPDAPLPSDEDEDQEDCGPVLVRLTEPGTVIADQNQSSRPVLAAVPANLSLPAAMTELGGTLARPPVTTIPLCDRARHERSGVQLI